MSLKKLFLALHLAFIASCTNVKDLNYDENMRRSQIHSHAARTANMLGQEELEKYHRDIASEKRYEAKSGLWEDFFTALLKHFD